MKHKTKKHIRTVLLLLTVLVWQQAAAQSTGTPLEPTAKEKKVFNTILADFATGWVTSEVTTPEGSYKWRNGQGFEISYRRLRKDGYGIGLEFAHSATNYPSRTYGGEYQLKANFYGISLLYGGFVGQKCIATVGGLPDGTLDPGETAYVVELSNFSARPVVYPGQRLTLLEGGKRVGEFIVGEIH